MSSDSPQELYGQHVQLSQQHPSSSSSSSFTAASQQQQQQQQPLPSMYSIVNIPANPHANMDMLASTASLRDLPHYYTQQPAPTPTPHPQIDYLQPTNVTTTRPSSTVSDASPVPPFVLATPYRSVDNSTIVQHGTTQSHHQVYQQVQQNVSVFHLDVPVEDILLKLNTSGSVVRSQVLDRLIPILSDSELDNLFLQLQKNRKSLDKLTSWCQTCVAEPVAIQSSNCNVEATERCKAQIPLSSVSAGLSILPLHTSSSMATQSVAEDLAHCETCSCHSEAVEDKPYKCDTCLKRFKKWRSLKVHAKSHTEEGSFKCKFCSKTFPRKEQRDIHERIHTKERPYQCSSCSKAFRSRGSLQTHLFLHTGLKPYKCHLCEKSFSGRSNLDNHIKLHTGEAPFACDVCAKRFVRKDYLVSHQKAAHSDKKPFTCEFCGQHFAWKNALKQHEAKHTDPKSYTCELCGKNYPAKSNLRMHMKTHSGVKPHACTFCGKRFLQKQDMSRHETIHTGHKPFSCSYCPKTFTRNREKKLHEKTHHALLCALQTP